MPSRWLTLIGTVLVLPLALSACGGKGGLPADAVVKIGGDTIKTTEFEHWLNATAKSQPGALVAHSAVPRPPDYKACVAEKQKTAQKSAKGQGKQTVAQSKALCEQEHEALRDQVLQFLISSAWVEGESRDNGVSVSDAEVKKDFEHQRQQNFRTASDYRQFLKATGYVQADLLYRIRVQDLSDKLRQKITKGSDRVTGADITKYYNSHKKQFEQPERRDMRIMVTKTKAKAKQARQRLDSGVPFEKVVAELSDLKAARPGTPMRGVMRDQQEKALGDASFTAEKGVAIGPVKSQYGYYIFVQVVKITPASQQTLEQVKGQIKRLITSQRQQDKLNAFLKTFQKKWKDRTDCRKGYVINVCKNAPKKAATTAAGAQTTTAGQ
jgi:foldase protein PrsA